MPVVGTGPGELSRTWTSNLNVITSDAGTVDTTEQYENSFFELFTHIDGTSGWTLVASAGKNGGGAHTAGAGNNILSSTDVTIGTEGSEDLSWAHWTNSTWVTGGSVHVLIVADNPSADVTPDEIEIWTALGTAFSGGDTQNRPTAPVEYMLAERNLLPQGAAAKVSSHAHMGRTANGDFWFGLSTDGTSVLETLIWFHSYDTTKALDVGGPDNANYAFHIFFAQSGLGMVNAVPWAFNNFSQCPTFGGTWLITHAAFGMVSEAEVGGGIDMDGWAGGVDAINGRVWAAEVVGIQNNINGRILGIVPDVRALPLNTPIGFTDDSDTAPVVYLSVQQIAFPVEDSQLPAVF